jgi:hypothetical protein
MCRLADVRLQLRENSMMGLGRSAGEAQQGTGSWPGSVRYSTAVHQVESRKPRISRENQWPQVQIEPRNRFVKQSLIHIIGNLPPLLEPNLEIDRSRLIACRAADISHPWGTCASWVSRNAIRSVESSTPHRAGDPVGVTFLSEDLDFSISIRPDATRSQRRGAASPADFRFRLCGLFRSFGRIVLEASHDRA